MGRLFTPAEFSVSVYRWRMRSQSASSVSFSPKFKSHRKGKGLFIFTATPAYWLMSLMVVPLIISIFLMLAGPALMLGGFALQVMAWLIAPFLAVQALYMTLTWRWGQYFGWLATRWAAFRDRFAGITTNVHLASRRFGSSEGNGFFLTMEPPSLSAGLKPKKVTFEDDRHVTMIAGSRAGKGRDFILPNLSHWQGSVIAYDPSGELVKETAAYRQNVLGQKIVILDPFGVTGYPSDSWNPMAEIDFDHDPLAIDKCHLLAESLHHEQTPDPFWMHAPRKMLASVIGYVGTRSIIENCHLGMVRDLLMTSDPKALWLAMSQNDALGGFLRRFGEANEHRHIEELNSTMELARTAMKWLDSPVMNTFTQSSTFSMRELKEGKVTVYIVMPAGMGGAYTPWLRMLFNAAFDVMQDTSIPKPENDVLFLLDEFPLLGTMERIKRAAGEAAKFGVKLFICAQDLSQLKEHYGQAWETFIANSGLLIMFANNDLDTQQYLSNRLGKEYYQKVSKSKSTSEPWLFESGTKSKSNSTSTSEELRDVARSDEVGHRSSRQSGDAFFFVPGMKPMQLPRASHDRWDMLKTDKQFIPRDDQSESSAITAIAAE